METIYKEIKVPVPWGHIAVKAWGDENNPPILVIHGRMDNAGAFDRLIPLLPKSFYYLCIDLPGHGRSSHVPSHLPLYTVSNLIVYRLVMKYFKRNSYIIIGHSYGGQIGFLFTHLYPELVEKLILIDTVHTIPVPVNCYRDHLRERIDSNIAVQEKLLSGQPPIYTYEQAFQRLMNGRDASPIIPEAAKALLERGIEPVGENRYRFTLDQRMKCYIDPLHDHRYLAASIKRAPLTCPILIILANESALHHILFKPIIQVVKKWRNVSIKYVDGNHDVHNNTPEVIAPHISKFLLRQKVPTEQKYAKNLMFKSLQLLKRIR